MSDHLPVAMAEKDPGSQPQRARNRNNDRAFVVFMFMLSAWYFWPWADIISYFGDIKTHTQSSQSCGAGALAGSETGFDWASITPSAELKWTKCFDDKECARLSVPLDYSDPEGEQAAVAMLKVPASVPSDSDLYRGPVLFNPGGPGGSGVSLIAAYGKSFQAILGSDFDLIGFDPRGIGHTVPGVSFFKTDLERAAWNLQSPGLLNATTGTLATALARAHIVGQLAQERNEKVSKHVSTAVVARDMLSITRAHGWEKLQYIGYSYGTILGATYAAMFPDNVGRLVIDGVADPENYYATLWSNNLRDSEKTLQFLYDACSAGGSDNCPLWEKTPALVKARVDAILSSIQKRPLSVRGSPGSSGYSIVDLKFVKTIIFGSMYKPFDMYPPLAYVLAALEKGDGAPILSFMPPTPLPCKCPTGNSSPFEAPSGDPGMAVMCTDGKPINDTIDELEVFAEEMSHISSFSDIWANIHVGCIGWKVRPAWRFEGQFVANTSFPLLIIGNTADPVTPLWAAQKVSKGFTGSVVLTQNSPGHCSLAATSLCTQKAIRAYFRNGTLPANGTTCEVQDKLFSNSTLSATAEEDTELLEAVEALRKGFNPTFA